MKTGLFLVIFFMGGALLEYVIEHIESPFLTIIGFSVGVLAYIIGIYLERKGDSYD